MSTLDLTKPSHQKSIATLRLLSSALREIEEPDPGELELADVFDALADQWGVGEVTPLVNACVRFSAAFARHLDITPELLAESLELPHKEAQT